jgi:glycerol-3-phosphate dehydrogenase
VEVVSDDPIASEADETFLLSVLSRVLDSPVTPQDVLGSFAGLRPLLAGADGPTADLSRDHRILERPDGLLTIVGGKLTTYRRMAEDVVDRVAARRGLEVRSRTASQPLVGAASRARLRGLPASAWSVSRYGTEAVEVEALLRERPELAAPVVEGSAHRLVELEWGVRHEGAIGVADLLDRRTRIGLVDSQRRAAERVAAAFLPAGEDVVA